MAAKQILDGHPDGTQIGASSSEKLAFHGKTACDQAAYVGTLGATSTTTGHKTMTIAIRDCLIEKGFMAAS